MRPEWVDCITKGPRINSEREGSQIQWNTSNTRQRHQARACVSRTSAEKKWITHSLSHSVSYLCRNRAAKMNANTNKQISGVTEPPNLILISLSRREYLVTRRKLTSCWKLSCRRKLPLSASSPKNYPASFSRCPFTPFLFFLTCASPIPPLPWTDLYSTRPPFAAAVYDSANTANNKTSSSCLSYLPFLNLRCKNSVLNLWALHQIVSLTTLDFKELLYTKIGSQKPNRLLTINYEFFYAILSNDWLKLMIDTQIFCKQ